MRITDLFESAPITLYHGTLREYIPEIHKHGLIPTVGELVSKFYDNRYDDDYDPEYDSLEPLVFAADKNQINKCIAAIKWRLRAKRIEDSPQNVIKYGALLIIKDENDDFVKAEMDGPYDHPRQVEPDDYYSDREQNVSIILTGNKLKDFLRRARIDGFYSLRPPNHEQKVSQKD